MREQDEKTERYMELLDKYIDHPDRDEIIGREMGWDFDSENDEDETVWDEAEELSEEEMEGILGNLEEEEAADEEEEEEFESHPLYNASFSLTIWIEELVESLGVRAGDPAPIKLSTQASITSAKLAAALNGNPSNEIGMGIAYLKRALKAVSLALEAALVVQEEYGLDIKRAALLRHRLFHVRDGIISLMGELRCEWRRRYGQGNG